MVEDNRCHRMAGIWIPRLESNIRRAVSNPQALKSAQAATDWQ